MSKTSVMASKLMAWSNRTICGQDLTDK